MTVEVTAEKFVETELLLFPAWPSCIERHDDDQGGFLQLEYVALLRLYVAKCS